MFALVGILTKLELGSSNGHFEMITETTSTPAARPSRIELLNAALIALDAEAETKENEIGLDAFVDAYCDQVDAIFDALSFEQPKTAREIGVMLRAANHHADVSGGEKVGQWSGGACAAAWRSNNRPLVSPTESLSRAFQDYNDLRTES